jgi:hypothetical protein
MVFAAEIAIGATGARMARRSPRTDAKRIPNGKTSGIPPCERI